MKKVAGFPVFLLAFLLILPLVSAQATLVFNQQPVDVYSLEDIVSASVNVRANSNAAGSFNMNLVCGSDEVNFYTTGISMAAGEERIIQASLILTENIIGGLRGSCSIKAFLGSNFVLSESFTISNVINVNSAMEKTDFAPSENLVISGQAAKENGRVANGFIDVSIAQNDLVFLSQTGRINNGSFSLNFSFPENMKAGSYTLRLQAYEKNAQEQTTNTGTFNKGIKIIQIPTNLRIVFETANAEPGTNLKVKTILYDQTGEKIQASPQIAIKNKNNQPVIETEIATDEFLEFPIANNEAPGLWKARATYNDLTAEASFNILEKEDAEIKIANKSLIITNIGNVPYNKTANVRIGGEERNIPVYLKVGESKKYILTAPNGEYSVEVVLGDKTFSEIVALTGSTVDIKDAPADISSFVRNPSWIFILLILGFVTFIVFKKGYQKSFFGYAPSGPSKTTKADESFVPLEKGSFVNTSSKAELALSIKGEKQDVPIIAVNIKNLVEIQAKKSNAEETIQKIINIAEEHKAVTYESHNVIYFILSPLKTKTFKNEATALNIASKIKEVLAHHNRMFKQRIAFGISLCYGTVVAAIGKGSFKFTGLGNILSTATKISSQAEENILLDEKMSSMLRNHAKTEKDRNSDAYLLKDIKTENEEHKKFLRKFMERNRE